MVGERSWKRAVGTGMLLAALGGAGPTALAQGYEAVPTFQAQQLVSAEQLSGPHHTLAPAVSADGYLYQFNIDSEFGQFPAEGMEMLETRLREVAALAELKDTTRSEAFTNALAHAATGPYRTAVSFVTHPVQTVTGIPGGIGRFLKGVGRTGGKTVRGSGQQQDDEQAAADTGESGETGAQQQQAPGSGSARSLLGMNSAKRRLAAELGVDPYSTNAVLQAELDRVAWASTAGGLVVKFAVPGIAVVGYVAEVENLVWNVSPDELEALNAEALTTMGVPRDSQDRLFDNPNFTPTLVTLLVHSLAALQVPGGQSEVVELANQAGSPAAAIFVTDALAMLRGYHEKVAPIATLGVRERLAYGIDAGNTLVAPLPVDHLYWDANIDVALGTLESLATRRDLRVSGAVTPVATAALQGRGWTINPQARAALLPPAASP